MQSSLATLSKKERLSGKSSISSLLSNGKWGSCRGMKFCVRTSTGEETNRLVVSVPKKYFKRAVKRNLLKRRIRESYRTQKSLLSLEGGVDILIQYNTTDIMDYPSIHSIVGDILSNIR